MPTVISFYCLENLNEESLFLGVGFKSSLTHKLTTIAALMLVGCGESL